MNGKWWTVNSNFINLPVAYNLK